MHGRSDSDLSVRRLRLFEAVAKHQHFGRAAKELFISPTALSDQIRKLEHDTGVQLFERTARGARLTPAGEHLLESVRRILKEVDRFDAAVRSHHRREHQTVRLGFAPLAAGRLTTTFVRRFEVDHQQFSIDLNFVDFSDQTAAVFSEEVDACIVRGPINLTGLRTMQLASEPRMVMASSNRWFANADSVTISDLRHELRVARANVPDDWHAWWSLDPAPDGSHPPYGPIVASFEEQLELAAIDRAISIVPASAMYSYRRPDVVFIPISDAAPSEILLCARDDNAGEGVGALFETAHAVFDR